MSSPARVASYQVPGPLRLLVVREQIAREPEAAADWKLVHERLAALGKERAGHERELGRWLLAAERLGAHVRVGYANLREYAERLVGLSGRQTEERLRVARALRELPALDAALAAGELLWSAVRELTRIATRETEGAWLAWARSRRARQVEQAVASRRVGEGPADRGDPSIVKHRLAFEVRAETMALFRDLEARVRADLGGQVDDDTLLLEIARRALGGPVDEGRASYQVAITRCEACGVTAVDAGGEPHPVDEVVAEMVACDAQVVPACPHVRAPGATQRATQRATQSIPPSVRRMVLRRDHKRCVVPGCKNHIYLDVHHLDRRADDGGHDPERLAVLCGAHHRAVHAGALCIDGRASAGLAFRHADGAPYGAPVTPASVEIARQAVGALESLGFKPTEARALVDAALRTGAPAETAALVRAALRASR